MAEKKKVCRSLDRDCFEADKPSKSAKLAAWMAKELELAVTVRAAAEVLATRLAGCQKAYTCVAL